VWREVYGAEPQAVPAYGPGWADAGGCETLALAGRRHMREIPCTEFQAGDVLLFRWRAHLSARHAGIAASATHMIHAQENACVSEVFLSAWWRRHLAFAFRFPGVDA
jgi:NlpC/P60 family putative phage cell wall peptidase